MNVNERHFQVNHAFSQAIASHQELILQGVRVLLVEDDSDTAELFIVLLEGVGAKVTWFGQAEAALAELEQIQPDVLISNVKLPQHSGDWLIKQIRQREAGQPQHLPAIAVSSYSRDVYADQMLAVGFERFLPKLYDLDAIVTEVSALVQGKF